MVNLSENLDPTEFSPETLEQLINLVEHAPAPGSDTMFDKETGIMEILARGDDNFPAPMVAQKMSEAQYCFVYDKFTGDRSIVNMNLLRAQLLKTMNDPADPRYGEKVFTTIKPDITPRIGNLPCRLNRNHPDREDIAVFGFPYCSKDDLNSPYDVKTHMERRHKQELATLEYEKREAKDRDDREFQRTLLLRNTNVRATEEIQLKAEIDDWRYTMTCDTCGHIEGSSVSIAATNKMNKHKRESHEDGGAERETGGDPESSGAVLNPSGEETREPDSQGTA